MFERYDEKARRVIFVARYEASNYGSPQIETEHILLGVMREGQTFIREVFGPNLDVTQIRTEIEKLITRRKSFPTSVEVPLWSKSFLPLSEESKHVLKFAAEECEGFGTRHVGLEHLLLGLLRVDSSLAARLLKEKGGKLELVRKKVGIYSAPVSANVESRNLDAPVAQLHRFLASLKSSDPGDSALLFAEDAQVIDFSGKRWKGREGIEKESKRLFVVYARKNVTSHLESVDNGPGHTVVASVLWENVLGEGGPSKSMHRMTVILTQEGEDWVVFFLQVTPVVVS
jgi:uncharacterized protein (TIGR02246 family)